MTKLSNYNLRAHHALCIQFFEGRGYSDEFVQEMKEIIKILDESNPKVTVVKNCDIICRACPNNAGGACFFEQKVNNFDRRCLEICELQAEDKLSWSELKKCAFEKIVAANRLGEVCGDCEWFQLCAKTKEE